MHDKLLIQDAAKSVVITPDGEVYWRPNDDTPAHCVGYFELDEGPDTGTHVVLDRPEGADWVDDPAEWAALRGRYDDSIFALAHHHFGARPLAIAQRRERDSE